MIRISPYPTPWYEAYQRLIAYAEVHGLEPPLRPLVLSLWNCSDDISKQKRWENHCQWATQNGCFDLLSQIPDSDFYFVNQVYIKPYYPRLFPKDDGRKKVRPSDKSLYNYMQILKEQWLEIAGNEVCLTATGPLGFYGKKARCLLVLADANVPPPWGAWGYYDSAGENQRYSFTVFRASICKAISPHVVDHICFYDNKIKCRIDNDGYKWKLIMEESLRRRRERKLNST